MHWNYCLFSAELKQVLLDEIAGMHIIVHSRIVKIEQMSFEFEAFKRWRIKGAIDGWQRVFR